MLSAYQARKKRYQEDIIRRIEANPQAYLDVDSPSERRGRPAKARSKSVVHSGNKGIGVQEAVMP